MKLLLDTQILIWLGFDSPNLTPDVRELLVQKNSQRFFSVVSLWETAIKASLQRLDFSVDVSVMRTLALRNGYHELPISFDHIVTLRSLPLHHRDPFDRMLVAQAKAEGLTLLTSDKDIVAYGGDVIKA
jgi:PIN domain nuclease of toxin-antitoxin system